MKIIYIILGVILIQGVSACNNGGSKYGSQENENAPAAKRYIRYNVRSQAKQAIKDLEDMRIAFDSMRKMDCSNPLSWFYQGAIHMVPMRLNPGIACRSYRSIMQGDKMLDGWGGCTHEESAVASGIIGADFYDTTKDSVTVYGKKCSRADAVRAINGIKNVNFLPWHRIYIWHLEKIIRKLSGDPAFALPYWDYTDTVNNKMSTRLVAAFADPKSSLYEASRFDTVNGMYPVNDSVTSNILLGAYRKLRGCRTFLEFASTIDNQPHNTMHSYIGSGPSARYAKTLSNSLDSGRKGGIMASTITAAYDPVFWIHHANIDRLWQQWSNSDSSEELVLDTLSKYWWSRYTFFDENGKKVNYSAKEVMQILYTMDYDYDDARVKPKASPNAPALVNEKIIVDAKVNKVINSNLVKFVVSPIKGTLSALGTAKEIVIYINASLSTSNPRIYEVFIDQPQKTSYDLNGNFFVGIMGFFGTCPDMVMNDGMGEMNPKPRSVKNFIFNFTNESRGPAMDREKFEFTILGGDKAFPIKIENVKIVAKN